ncbi:tumor necrosis factor receptor superfamily member 1B-like [Megalops cyprinoides]|uniref:tumor necrosis factor receptor superfamily member 1B-like n=1 Tax=Megalops cyprinoides TaxID=118141 RepID=UPI0018646716|nr:tumor necrosis factor receptor superfamily member 1B-like [Megalops cyprinoides]
MFWKTRYLLLVAALHLANKVRALPYAPDDQGRCWNNGTYLNKEQMLCCSLCAPGFHLKERCTPTKDTVCAECRKGVYSENWNYFHQCFKCSSCREDKGMEFVQSCTTSADAKCACKEGMFCSYKLNNKCRDCSRFTTCPPGQGVSMQGTADSDVRCSPCTAGTFSDKKSYTEPCRPHTNCEFQGRNTLRPGNATSDTVCGQIVRLPFITTTTTTTTPTPTPTSIPSKAIGRAVEPVPNTTNSGTVTSNGNRKPEDNTHLIATVLGFGAGAVLLIVLMICIHICIRNHRGDTNNNIDKEANKTLQGSSMSCQRNSSSSRPPEQQCLLGEKDSSSTSISTTSSKTESMVCCRSGYGGQEGSGGVYQRQDSPQMSSPTVTVNINATINCHLPTGTRFCSVPTSPATDSAPSDCNLPLSTEEERSDLLKVGEAKDARPAVQESGKVVC